MRHIISVLLQNEPGALSRMAGMFSSRGFNIESLSVAPTQDETVSRVTLVTNGTNAVLAQINKQLYKMVDVVQLDDMTTDKHIERELLLLKVQAEGDGREPVRDIVARERGRILDDTESTYTVELTGTQQQIDEFIAEMRNLAEIIEVVRTGVSGIAKGDRSLLSAGFTP